MKEHHVTAPGFDAVENISKVIQIEVIADRYKNIPGPRADRLWTQLAFQLKVELVHFHMTADAISGATLGNGKHDVQNHRKSATGDCCYRLGGQVRGGGGQKGPGGQTHTA